MTKVVDQCPVVLVPRHISRSKLVQAEVIGDHVNTFGVAETFKTNKVETSRARKNFRYEFVGALKFVLFTMFTFYFCHELAGHDEASRPRNALNLFHIDGSRLVFTLPIIFLFLIRVNQILLDLVLRTFVFVELRHLIKFPFFAVEEVVVCRIDRDDSVSDNDRIEFLLFVLLELYVEAFQIGQRHLFDNFVRVATLVLFFLSDLYQIFLVVHEVQHVHG